MNLTRYEQEVIINFNAEDENCTLYTANPAWIRKMDKLLESNPDEFKQIDFQTMKGELVSKTYSFPKKLVSVRSKTIKLSEDAKKKRIKQLKG